MPAERESLAERVARRLAASGAAEPAPPSPVPDAPSSPPPCRKAPAAASIDLARLGAEGIVVPGIPRSGLTEAFRAIKRALPDQPGKDGIAAMVTSARPGEGKTFISLNLAMSLCAEPGLTVLLVDSDHIRRTLARRLGIVREKGLGEVLAGEVASVEEVLVPTNLPNLHFLPSGRERQDFAELLEGRRFARALAAAAAGRGRWIAIVDTPPVLSCGEAAALARQVDRCLVTVEKDVTPKRALRRTLDLLEGCPSIGCVLNMAADALGLSSYEYYDHGPT